MNILITGGAGYIGSHTAEYIFNQGCNPIVFDNLYHGKKKYVKFGPFIKGDLTEYNEYFTDGAHFKLSTSKYLSPIIKIFFNELP